MIGVMTTSSIPDAKFINQLNCVDAFRLLVVSRLLPQDNPAVVALSIVSLEARPMPPVAVLGVSLGFYPLCEPRTYGGDRVANAFSMICVV